MEETCGAADVSGIEEEKEVEGVEEAEEEE